MTARLHIQFAAPTIVCEEVPHRLSVVLNSPGKVAQRDLARYYKMIRDELRACDFTLTEAASIALACRLWPRMQEKHRRSLVDTVFAFLDDPASGLTAKQNGFPIISASEAFVLRIKLRQLRAGGTVAVTDAIERYWLLEREHDSDTLSTQFLADAGLTFPPETTDD